MHAPVALLVNPVAGEGHGIDRWPEVERVLAGRGGVSRIEPSGEYSFANAARAAAEAGQILAIAGGDGTVNRVVNAIAGNHAVIGIVPVGSGNDLARALGLPVDPVHAARRIAGGTVRVLDLVAVNGQRFCTVGGLGLMADVTVAVSRLALPGRATRPAVRWLGPNAYLLMAAVRLALPATRAREVRVEGDGPDGPWHWRGEAHAVLVANQPTLGAGLMLPVDSSASDGACEICIVPRCSRVSLASRMMALRTGRPQPDAVLTVRRARTALIEVAAVTPFAADGDVLCMERRFEITVLPGALHVIV